MIIQQDESTATYLINRYEPGKIWINQTCYTHSVIIRPAHLTKWRPNQLSEVTNEDFLTLYEEQPKILLIGTGKALIIPSQDLLQPLFEKGMGVEFMDSKAACYTYTILASEQRNVAACILIT